MSQYGARGRALAGQNVSTILGHYYQGTSLSTIDSNTPIRVRILSAWASAPDKPLVICGRKEAWTIDGIDASFPADARLRLRPSITAVDGVTSVAWRLTVTADGVLLLDRPIDHSFRIRPASGRGRLELVSKPSSFDTYRGVIRVFPKFSAPTITAVNELKLETYLRGVVPAEMPSSWPTPARGRSVRCRRRHELAGLSRRARRTIGGNRGDQGHRRPGRDERWDDRQYPVSLDRWGGDRGQRERFRQRDRGSGGVARQLPAWID
jgi:hypothetical protein